MRPFRVAPQVGVARVPGRLLAGIPASACLLVIAWHGTAFAADAGDSSAETAAPVAEAAVAEAAEAEAPVAEAAEAEAPVAEAAVAPEQPAAGQRWIHGSLEAGFDGAWSDGESDVNLNQTLQLRIDPPQYQRLHVRGSLWMHEDLDGDESRSSLLRDINDASRSDVRARLLYLYADVDDVWGDGVLRIGRQRIMEGAAYNRVDGVYFKQRHRGWDWYVFGGARASVYDDTHRDGVAGMGASLSLTPKTRVAIDWYYGTDRRGDNDDVYRDPVLAWFGFRYPRRVERKVDDSLVSLSVWQDVTTNLRLFGRLDIEDGDADELTLEAVGYVPCWELTYELSYRGRFESAGDRVNDVTAFYRILDELNEYDHYRVALHKALTPRLALSLEAELHEAEGDYWLSGNRDYRRYAADLSATGLFAGVDASVGVEKWDVEDGESTWAVTGELKKRWTRLELAVGADYQRYEDRLVYYSPGPHWLDQLAVSVIPGYYAGYNPAVWLFDTWKVETHEDIRAFYAKAKYALTENQDLTAGVTFEEDDGPESPYWRVQVGYALRF